MSAKKQNPFPLKSFRGVDPDHIARLEAIGIKKAPQMLAAGGTPAKRTKLARATGIPEESILELVRLSDLARLPGVKGIRARLYYDAGITSVAKMASCQAEDLLQLTADFVQKTGFEGIPPLPKEVQSTIENARNFPKLLVE